MPTYSITDPSGKVYSIDGPSGATQEQVIAQIQAAQKSASAPQPSTMDRIVASPIGRGIHDIGVRGLEGAASLATMFPLLSGVKPSVDMLTNATEDAYQGSLGRNRNTPGYAPARAAADTQIQQMGGSGLSDQVMAPFAQTVAGLAGLPGGLDSSNAAADARGAAMDAFAGRHPALSTAAQVLGGFMAGPEAGLARPPAAVAKQVAPTVTDLKAASRVGYKRVDNSGVRISTDAVNHVADSIADKFGGQVDPILYPKATAAYNRILQYGTEGAKGDAPMTFSELDRLKRIVGSATKSPDTADAGLAGQMLEHLGGFEDNLTAAHLDTTLQDELRTNLMSATAQKGQIAKQIKSIEKNKPGSLAARGAAGADTRATYMDLQEQLPAAEEARLAALGDFKAESDLIKGGPQDTIDTLKSARGLWARAKQTETIKGVIDDAQLNAGKGSSLEQSLRNGFASLAKNDKQMARLSPEVQKEVRAVVMGAPATNLFRFVGKLAPRGIVSTALSTGMGGAIAGVPGAVALPMIGEAARMGATRATLGAANNAADIAALGRSARPVVPQPALQLPRLPANGRLPLGLIGSGVLNQPLVVRR